DKQDNHNVIKRNIGLAVSPSLMFGLFSEFLQKTIPYGGKVLGASPSYGMTFNTIMECGGFYVTETCTEENNWKITPPKLKGLLERNSDALVYVFLHPENPTGVVYSKEELEELASVFVAHNKFRESQKLPPLTVAVDQVAGRVRLDSEEPLPVLGLMPGMWPFTYTMLSLSKDISPGTGIAIGFGPEAVVNQVRPRHGVPYPTQHAAAVTFSDEPEVMEKLTAHIRRNNAEYLKNLEFITLKMQEMSIKISQHFGREYNPEVPIMAPLVKPQGGFQLLAHAPGLFGARFPQDYRLCDDPAKRNSNSSVDLARYMRDKAKVVVVPGEGFDIDPTKMAFRMTLSKHPRTYEKMFRVLEEVFLQLGPPEIENTRNNKGSSRIFR
ncbi:MAG: aminotransferase class I/II-fold pyridoxal phosphate-dependent enzyme, partial [Rickettsiales bacterium]|nr:aminotransferase class I/II-fold pyridoxal phosphate-dependent enzyme [Rickettsiales bacterium]